MTEAEKYIYYYPEINLNTQDEEYYGYPKSLPKDMTDFISSDFDWQNSKIGIVNDFGLQVVKYLHFEKDVPFENVTILLIKKSQEINCREIEDFIDEFSFTKLNFDYIDLDNKNMSKEKFDLIIANPPFGDHGKLAKSVANTVHDMAINSVIVSIPTGFKDIYIYI